jgi:hypothetical protein
MGELAKLTASAPVLLVKDVVAGANHYSVEGTAKPQVRKKLLR